jgi:hypothetical protein
MLIDTNSWKSIVREITIAPSREVTGGAMGFRKSPILNQVYQMVDTKSFELNTELLQG